VTRLHSAGYLRDIQLAGMNAVLAAAALRGHRPAPLGASPGPDDWINLGQGQPEIGPLAGAPPRVTTIELEPGDHAYSPVNGTPALREAVAAHYNRLYRSGQTSQYAARNVSITAGGRIALNRVVAALGATGATLEIGFRLPDYAAYHDILERNMPRLRPVSGAAGAGAFLMSNPRNPTGDVVAGADLAALVAAHAATGCALIVDEFYSHYIYEPGPDGVFGPAVGPVSAAAHVADVDADPVFVIDGLTKNFRYPGWRLGWVVGPADAIGIIERVGQDLDGGPSQVTQRAALAVMSPSAADRETSAVRAHFANKRNAMVDGLRHAGIRVDTEPRGGFYVWGDLRDMPVPLRRARDFFEAALDRKVITVPGEAFELAPGAARTGMFDSHVRFSYGPALEVVLEGLRRLHEMTAGA
jgi:aspartate/methionine/tyrosine aminotransferase